MIRVNKKVEGDIRIYVNSDLRKISKKELKESLENIEFKKQNEKEMQKELEYVAFNIQFIEYLSIGSKKDNNIEVYFSTISFGRKKAEITIERNYILCNFLRKLMKSGI